MSIINNPMLLDETGLLIAEEMDRKNALLSILSEGRRDTIYSSISQVANIVRSGYGEKAFQVGDQFIIPWKDMDDAAHNTDGTAYQVPVNIVAHGDVTIESGETVPGMFLQWDNSTPYGVQFSNFQAFMKCVTELAAGTYYVTFGGTWGSKGANSGTSWSFTLTQNVPAGGRLSGFESLPDIETASFKVKSWATPLSAAPIEIVNVSSGAIGTNLGMMSLNSAPGALNNMQRVGYGSNRWGTEAIRQYLNKTGLNWFTANGDFDIRPNEHTKRGFMSGFSADFLSAIKPVKVTTALNTVEGYSTQTEETYDKFFLPSLEQMNITPQLASAEGPRFPYWQRRMGLPGFGLQGGTYSRLKTAPINNPASPQYVRLRSACRGGAGDTWGVYSSGSVSGDSASDAYRCSPVCVIC